MNSGDCRPTWVIGPGDAQHENAEENVQKNVGHGSNSKQFMPQRFVSVDPTEKSQLKACRLDGKSSRELYILWVAEATARFSAGNT